MPIEVYLLDLPKDTDVPLPLSRDSSIQSTLDQAFDHGFSTSIIELDTSTYAGRRMLSDIADKATSRRQLTEGTYVLKTPDPQNILSPQGIAVRVYGNKTPQLIYYQEGENPDYSPQWSWLRRTQVLGEYQTREAKTTFVAQRVILLQEG